MDTSEASGWAGMTPQEKRKKLYDTQKQTLDLFLERRAISRADYEKSLHDLTEKMDMQSSLTA
jgi:hypothetical protein